MNEIIRGTSVDEPAPAAARASRRHQYNIIVGGALVAFVVLTALVSYLWTPYDPTRVNPPDKLAPLSWEHLLGADQYGRDVLSQLMVGARTTLLVGIVATLIAGTLGVPLGLLAALRGRVADELVMRGSDMILAFPALLMAIMFAAAFGASTRTAMVAIGIAYIPVFARLTRGSALQVRTSDYVLAARASGRGRLAIAARHVMPNVSAVLLVQATVLFSIAVLAEAALSFLGLGTPPPTPSWGRMLQEAQTFVYGEPLLSLWPGLAIALTVLGFNLLGDGLRDVLDPRLREERR